MTELKKTLRLSGRHFYTKHLEIISPILPFNLTSKEMEVLGAFMAIEGGEITEEDRFCTSARKIVKSQLNLKDGGLGNFLKALKSKNVIQDVNGKLVIPEALFPRSKFEQQYIYTLKNE